MQNPALTALGALDRSGNPIAVSGLPSDGKKRRVYLSAGTNIQISADDSGNVSISVVPGDGDDPAYRAKFNTISRSGGGVFDGVTYKGVPYYVATVNNQGPDSMGDLSLLGGLCGQIGLLLPEEDLSSAQADAASGKLTLFDICEACLDCADYNKLDSYTQLIQAALNSNKSGNTDTGVKLLKQYEALVRMWNFMVHSGSLILKVSTFGKQVLVVFGYSVPCCGPFSSPSVSVVATNESDTVGAPSLLDSETSRVGLSKTLTADAHGATLTCSGGMVIGDYVIGTIAFTPTAGTSETWTLTGTWSGIHIDGGATRSATVVAEAAT